MKKTILAISLFILGWTAPLSAEVMTYQGRLKESNVPVNANRTFLFELCATETPTGCVVSPDGAKPFAVQNGLFKSTFTLPAVDLSVGPWYLRVKVEGNYLSPVEKLTFVPYSLYASTAGYSPAALQKAGDTMTGQLTLSGSSLTLTGSEFSVGASTLVVKAGHVGVGTVSPQYPLTVYGDTAANMINVGDQANIGGDTAGFGLDSFGTYAGAALYANNVKVLNVEQNGGAVIGSTYMTADAVRNGLIVQGNVGIGTAVPNYALQISSGAGEAGTIMAVSTGATNLFWVAGDGAHSFRFTGDGSGLTGVTGASGTDSSKLPLTGGTLAGQLTLSGSTLTVTGDAFSVGGSTFVVVNGNVGIGTATPAAGYELHVMGQATDNGDVRIESGSGTSLALSALNAGYVNIQTALGVSNGGDLVLQAAAGNVGIGMVSPGAMLDVAGSGNFSGSVTSLSSGTFKATGPGQFSVETSSGILVQTGRIQAPAIQLTNGAAANYVLSSDAAGNATWVNPAAGGVGDGWVGNEIADAADASLTRSGAGIAVDPYKIGLNLANPNTWTAGQTFNAGLAGGLTGAASMNVLKAGDTMTGGLTLAGSTLTVTGDAFSVGGSTLVVAGGYLGLGTNAPAARLDVVSDNGYLHFRSPNSSLTMNMIPQTYAPAILNNNGDGPIGFSIANNVQMWLDRQNLVGIGTQTPLYRLHVSSGAGESGIIMAVSTGTSVVFGVKGNGEISGGKFIGDGSGLTNLPVPGGLVSIAGDTMTGQLTNTSSVTITGNGGGAYGLGVSSNVSLAGALYSANGKVGIGTTTPTGKLHVYSPGQSRLYLDSPDDAAMLILNSGATGNFVGMTIQTGNTARWSIGENIGTTEIPNYTIYDEAAATSRFYINRSGNVGIGTTAPSYRLHVSSAAGEAGTVMAVSTGATNLFWVAGDGAHAVKYFGDGSGLTGVSGADATKLPLTGGNLTGQLTLANSTLTVTGNAFSVAGSTLVVSAGKVGVGNANPAYELEVQGTIRSYTPAGGNGRIFLGDGDIAHGMTGLVPTTDTFGLLTANSGSGGLHVGGFSSGASFSGLHLGGTIGGTDPTDTVPAVQIDGAKQSGVSWQPLGSLETILGVRNNGGANLLAVLGNGRVGIGVAAPDQKLTVAGNISQTGVLISSGAGTNYFAGDVTAARYQINGSTVLAILPGAGSLGIGPNAGRVNTADSNLFVGVDAGFANDSGIANTFVGSQAGYGNITGIANTFMGSSAGMSNTVGGNNSFFGNQAGFSNNGDGNAFFGSNAGTNNLGSNNVFIGANAGLNASGTGNIVIGYNKDTSVPAANSELNIGGVLYGNLAARTIGISTRVPQAALDIVSTATSVNVYAQIWRDSTGLVVASMTSTGRISGDGSGLTGVSATDATKLPLAGGTLSGQLTLSGSTLTVIGADGPVNAGVLWASTSTVTPALYVSTTGRVGIGTASPGYPLHVIERSGQVGIRLEGYDASADSIYIDSKNSGKPTYGYVRGGLLRADTQVDTSNRFNIKVNSLERLTITPQGFVGINDLSPSYLFHVSTTAGETGTIMAVSTGTTDIFWVAGDGAHATRYFGDGSGLTGISATDATKLPLGGGTLTGQLTLAGSSLTVTGDITGARYQIKGSTIVAILPGAESLGIGVNAGRVNTGNYNVFVGSAAGYNSTIGANNSFLGYVAGFSNTTGGNNSFLGYNAGRNNTTGGNNLFLGANAGFSTDVGTDNSFIGTNAGYSNTSGGSNSFVGTWAGYFNTTGMENSFMGYNAGRFNTTGASNSFVGVTAGYSNTTGGDNAYVGYSAGFNNKVGSANAIVGRQAGFGLVNNSFSSSTLMGYRAGYGLTTGSDNILLGFQAGYTVTTGTGNIVIGYNKDTTAPAANNQLNIGGVLYGDLSARTIGISTRVPQAALDIVSTGSAVNQYAQIWRDSTGLVVASMTATGRLSGDGSGLTGVSATDATKLPIAGGIMTGNLNMGGMNIYAASTITASGDITAARYQINGSTVLAMLPGAGSLGIGPNSGRVNSGIDNLFIGESAGYSNTTGTQNLFIGYQAGYINSIGNANALIGYQAGFSNTGDYNTFVGADTGASNTAGTNNTNVGHLAGYNNQTGSFNTILGNEAGYGVSGNSFSESTLVGDKAGNALTTGSGNILLGFRAGQLITNGADNIVIGYAENTSAPGASNELSIGGVLYGDLAAKTIGISTRVPQAALDIVSTGSAVNQYAQIWRDSTGLVVASMTATGRLSGDGSGLSGVTVANGVYTTAANTFTNISAPVLIQPSGAPAADTKLLDMRPTGPSVTNFSVDSEGDVTTTGSMLVLKTDNTSSSILTLETDNNANNILELTKYASTAGGSEAGGTILRTNLSRVAAGATAGPLMLLVGTNNPMYFVTNNTERMRIATGGNVGIATATPVGLFQVGGGSLTVLSGGKVGIGTTSPARKLEVNGEITASRYEIGGSTVIAVLQGTESLAYGLGAGDSNTPTGNMNVFVGNYAGPANTSGSANTFLGNRAGYVNTTGQQNTFLGQYSGYDNTNGSQNTFLGSIAGRYFVSGAANVAVGYGAGYGVNTATFYSSSTVVGYKAGYGLTTGSDNTFLGWQAGFNVTTGTGNVVIGYDKRTTAPSASNELNIGGVLYGDLSARTIGISTRVPQAALDVVSTGTASNIYAQIWRDGSGVPVASMTSTGRLSGDGSGLTGVSASDATKLPLAGGMLTGGLTVTGASITVNSSDGQLLKLNSNVTYAGVSFWNNNITQNGVLGFGNNGGIFIPAINGAMALAGYSGLHLGATSKAALTITTLDKVGVGTISPLYALDISTANNTDPYVFRAGVDGVVISTGGAITTTGMGHGTVGDSARGNGAVDLQTSRSVSDQVASGEYAVIAGGRSNKAANTDVVVSGGFNNWADQPYGFIGGGSNNKVQNLNGAVVGGNANQANAQYAFVGSGANNVAGGVYSVISGGQSNIVSGYNSATGGGGYNVVKGSNSVIPGGYYNTVIATSAVVAGGERNNASGMFSAVSGGFNNTASGISSSLAGGKGNTASGDYSAVAGGYSNTASNYAFTGGGNGNFASGGYSVVGGGQSNQSSNGWTTVGGGNANVASQNNATVGGGSGNTASSYSGTVAGGSFNNVQSTAYAGFIGGGGNNISTGAYSTVGGGRLNTSSGAYSAVLGGSANVAEGAYSGVAGGSSNRAYGVNSAVTGGNLNSAWGNFSTVSGGNNNSAAGLYSMIAGGDFNSAGGQGSAVVGGNLNNASGTSSFIGGGGSNEAKGWGAVVFGGNNAAMGGFSFAAGYRSTSAVDGTFTWSDSQGIEVVNNVQDQVMFKAKGGFWVSTGTIYANPALYIDAANNIGIGTAFPTAKLHLANAGDGIRFPDGTLQTTAGVGSASDVTSPTDAIINGDSDGNMSGSVKLKTAGLDRVHVSTGGQVGIGTTNPSVMFHNAGSAILASNYTTIDPDSYGSAVIAGALSDGGWTVSAGIGGMVTNVGTTWGIGHNNADLLFAAGDSTNPNTMQTFMQATWKRNLALVPVSGKVGIGTSAIPDQKLTVIGSISQTGVLISSGAGNNYFAGNVGIGTNTPVAMLDVNGTARLARHVVESRDSGGTMSADDFGKTITVNSASPQAIALPVGTAGSVGAQFTFVKLGTGKLTLNAGATDFIADSSMAGNIYNDAVSPAFATITLRLVTSNKWMLVGGEGAWVTQ